MYIYQPFMVKRGMVGYCFSNTSKNDPLLLGCSPRPDIQLLAQQIGTSLSLQENQLQMLRILPGFAQWHRHLFGQTLQQVGSKMGPPKEVTQVYSEVEVFGHALLVGGFNMFQPL